MSAQSEVERVQRELEAFYRKQSDEAKKEASVLEKIASARAAASRATSPTSARSKLSEAARMEHDLVNIQKKKADIAKCIAGTVAKLHKGQQRVADEQSREHRRMIDALKRQQMESRHLQDRRLLEAMAPISSAKSARIDYDAFISHASVRPAAQAGTVVDHGWRLGKL